MPLAFTFVCLAAVAIDGDTLRCANLREEANGRVRLARIDAAELHDPGGEQAKRALAALIAGRTVRCQLVDADPRIGGFQARDRFGRPVARCGADGVDLQRAMLDAGQARVWP